MENLDILKRILLADSDITPNYANKIIESLQRGNVNDLVLNDKNDFLTMHIIEYYNSQTTLDGFILKLKGTLKSVNDIINKADLLNKSILNEMENIQLMADYIEIEFENFYPHKSWEDMHKVMSKIESEGYWINRVLGDITICDSDGRTIVKNPNHDGGLDGYMKLCTQFIKMQYSFKG